MASELLEKDFRNYAKAVLARDAYKDALRELSAAVYDFVKAQVNSSKNPSVVASARVVSTGETLKEVRAAAESLLKEADDERDERAESEDTCSVDGCKDVRHVGWGSKYCTYHRYWRTNAETS